MVTEAATETATGTTPRASDAFRWRVSLQARGLWWAPRFISLGHSSGVLDERSVAQLDVGPLELRLGIHHDRSGPRDRLLERPARDEQEPDPLVAGPDRDLVARVEQDEGPVAALVPHQGVAAPFPNPFREDAAGRRGVPEGPAPLEHVGERVARRLDGQGLAHTRWHPHVEIARLGGNPFDRTGLAPEASGDHPHPRAVVVHDFRDVLPQDVLVARIGHLERPGKIGPELESVHPAALVAARHLLVENPRARRHTLDVPGAK